MFKTKSLILKVFFASILLVGLTAASVMHFRADLRGSNEVPPVNTSATGQAFLKYNVETGRLSFQVTVKNIPPVVAAHIHCAPAGQNGPVGVTLFMGGPVNVNGLLAKGRIGAPDAGNNCGWQTVADIVAAIQAGNAYVNVHTTAHPSGEIRGQLTMFP